MLVALALAARSRFSIPDLLRKRPALQLFRVDDGTAERIHARTPHGDDRAQHHLVASRGTP